MTSYQILEQVESFKEKITDAEYKTVVDLLMERYHTQEDENRPPAIVKQLQSYIQRNTDNETEINWLKQRLESENRYNRNLERGLAINFLAIICICICMWL